MISSFLIYFNIIPVYTDCKVAANLAWPHVFGEHRGDPRDHVTIGSPTGICVNVSCALYVYYYLHLNQSKHATRQPLENSTDLVSLSQSSPYSWAERPALDIHVYLYGIAARLQFKAVSHELLPASVRTGDYDDSKG